MIEIPRIFRRRYNPESNLRIGQKIKRELKNSSSFHDELFAISFLTSLTLLLAASCLFPMSCICLTRAFSILDSYREMVLVFLSLQIFTSFRNFSIIASFLLTLPLNLFQTSISFLATLVFLLCFCVVVYLPVPHLLAVFVLSTYRCFEDIEQLHFDL